MAQTKPKAGQFYGVSGNGTAGQVLISDGNGGMSWGSNTEEFTVSWATPTGQSLTYTQPNPQSSTDVAGATFPSTTFTVTKSDTIISGTATIAGLPTGITATQVITGSGIGNILTVTLAGIFPVADSLNTDLTLSGLTLSSIVSWATPTGQSLTYGPPNPQSSTGLPGTTFPTTTFTATKSGEEISGTATIAGLPTGITATQSLSGTGADNILTVTLTGTFPGADSLNTALTLSGLTVIVPITVSYLVVAGGGGGSSGYGGIGGGGGGAGGLRSSYGSTGGGPTWANENIISIIVGVNYQITIGGGGSGSQASSGATGVSGSNSVFNNITSIGGGGAKSYQISQVPGSSLSGGSGGGGAWTTITPGAAVTSPVTHGYAGGAGTNSGPSYGGGGGGGAGAVGVSSSGSSAGGGGVGLQVNIDGSSNYYAGGGGSGTSQTSGAGTGGSSVGGNGGTINNIGGNATPYRGSGGGGGGAGNTVIAGNGSGGIVILRYPSNLTISGLSGTTTTISTDKVTTFTAGTGNIQFN